MNTRRMWVAASLAAATVAGITVSAAPAVASPGVGPFTVVAMGDSFISGEGGRWAGQADNPQTDRGTGAYTVDGISTWTDAGNPLAVGCHRSDSAPIKGVPATAAVGINIACSGAQTFNVWRGDHGGSAWRSEAPQSDQLSSIALTNDVKAIFLSIGGNDFGFADIVKACMAAYLNAYGSCHESQDGQIRAKADQVRANIRHAIDDIRATMTARNYTNDQYRIIVQSYPSPLPDSAHRRTSYDGCNLHGSDLDWVNQTLMPRLAGTIRVAVRESDQGTGFTNAQFLDLSDALRGHELCNKDAQFSTTSRPAQEVAEWVNWIPLGIVDVIPGVSLLNAQRQAEAAHPNFFGQLALQQCVAQMLNQAAGDFRCVNDGGAGHVGIGLHALGAWNSAYAAAQMRRGGTTIAVNECIIAANGTAKLCFKNNKVSLFHGTSTTPVWSSPTGPVGSTAAFQSDGNLVIRTSTGQPFWSSDTGGNPDSELVMDNDGWARILNPAGTVLWVSSSNGGGGGGGGGSGGGSGGGPIYQN